MASWEHATPPKRPHPHHRPPTWVTVSTSPYHNASPSPSPRLRHRRQCDTSRASAALTAAAAAALATEAAPPPEVPLPTTASRSPEECPTPRELPITPIRHRHTHCTVAHRLSRPHSRPYAHTYTRGLTMPPATAGTRRGNARAAWSPRDQAHSERSPLGRHHRHHCHYRDRRPIDARPARHRPVASSQPRPLPGVRLSPSASNRPGHRPAGRRAPPPQRFSGIDLSAIMPAYPNSGPALARCGCGCCQ